MKNLKSLKNLESFKVQNLNNIKGGVAQEPGVTSGGETCGSDGKCYAWDYDTRTSGGNFNYHNLRVVDKPC